MDADVFITIVFASLVGVLTLLGAYTVIHSVRDDRERATRARQDQ